MLTSEMLGFVLSVSDSGGKAELKMDGKTIWPQFENQERGRYFNRSTDEAEKHSLSSQNSSRKAVNQILKLLETEECLNQIINFACISCSRFFLVLRFTCPFFVI